MTDWALACALLLPDAKFRLAGSYEELVATWADARPIPAKLDLETAWAAYQQQESDVGIIKQQVRNSILPLVGRDFTSLTTNEKILMVDGVLWALGCIDRHSGKVAKLQDWFRV